MSLHPCQILVDSCPTYDLREIDRGHYSTFLIRYAIGVDMLYHDEWRLTVLCMDRM